MTNKLYPELSSTLSAKKEQINESHMFTLFFRIIISFLTKFILRRIS
jgi:hypothetical protein